MTLELGKLITSDEERDAVHIAIIPMVAGMDLLPGTHVRINQLKEAIETDYEKDSIGIVDPFLKYAVAEGQKFWLLLYPNTITSLRHDWTHPSFKREETPIEILLGDREESKRWLEEFAESGRVSYERLMEMAEDRQFTFRTEMYDFNDDNNKHLFWRHYEIVTGNRVPTYIIENTYFGCAC
jgi:hypothetical protein